MRTDNHLDSLAEAIVGHISCCISMSNILMLTRIQPLSELQSYRPPHCGASNICQKEINTSTLKGRGTHFEGKESKEHTKKNSISQVVHYFTKALFFAVS